MINTVFNKIDEIIEKLETISKENNKNIWHSCHRYDEYCSIENTIGAIDELNPFGIPYIWKEKEYNSFSRHFIFRTEAEYMNRGLTSDYILENSELRKCFYKDDNIEVGLTIEENLKPPTDTHWGYSFSKPKYYIIKNNEITITESRSLIRKIFNNKDIKEKEYNLIRLDDTIKEYSKEIYNFRNLYNGVYFAEIDFEDCIIYKDKKDLVYYCADLMKEEMKYTKDNIISLYGGVDEIFERIVSGNNCSLETMLMHNMDFCFDYLNIERIEYGDNPITVTFSDLNIDSDVDITNYNVIYYNS